jgi:hypothetical protein
VLLHTVVLSHCRKLDFRLRERRRTNNVTVPLRTEPQQQVVCKKPAVAGCTLDTLNLYWQPFCHTVLSKTRTFMPTGYKPTMTILTLCMRGIVGITRAYNHPVSGTILYKFMRSKLKFLVPYFIQLPL